MKRHFLLIFCLGVTTSVIAQNLPNDTDMRAMYCLRVLLPLVQAVKETGIDNLQGTSDKEKNKALKELQEKSKEFYEKYNRVQRYMAARIPVLEASSLIAVANQSDSDGKRTEACVVGCVRWDGAAETLDVAKMNACQKQCDKELSGLISRRNGCLTVDYLPY